MGSARPGGVRILVPDPQVGLNEIECRNGCERDVHLRSPVVGGAMRLISDQMPSGANVRAVMALVSSVNGVRHPCWVSVGFSSRNRAAESS